MDSASGVNIPSSTLDAIAPAHRQETHSVERVIGEFVDAWNRHDPAQMAALWALDGDLINPWGELFRGRDRVRANFENEQRGPMKTSSHEMTLESVRWASDNVVVVDAECAITGMCGPNGEAMPTFKPHVLLVLGKSDRDWEVLSARPYEYSKRPAGK